MFGGSVNEMGVIDSLHEMMRGAHSWKQGVDQ